MPSAGTRIVPAPSIRPWGVKIIAGLAKAARSRGSEPFTRLFVQHVFLRRLLLSKKSRRAPQARLGLQAGVRKSRMRSVTLKAIREIVAGPEGGRPAGSPARPGTGQELFFPPWKALSIWPWPVRL
jgi:hypothetical protein